jgi:integrase
LLSAHTAAGPGEIKHLRLKDVYLGDGNYTPDAWIKIREAAKNCHRLRTIPLDREAFGAVQALLRIAQSRGAHLPDHYLLPARVKHGAYYDPTRCQMHFQTAWDGMLAAADITHFRMYDLRHHALTRLAETNPEQVVLKIAGHVSGNMLRKVYAHVRDDAVRKAIDGLSRQGEGWKPSIATARKIMPRCVSLANMQMATRNAKKIVREETDDSWIRLAGEAS